MSSRYRYTMALHEGSRKVWAHYSGDREEMMRTVARGLPHLDVEEARAMRFVQEVQALDETQLEPGMEIGAVVLTDDLASRVTFDIRRTS